MTSTLGQGTVFTLRIPLRLAGDAENAAAADPAPFFRMNAEFASNHPLRILVVEDDKVNLKLMLGVLRSLGYEPYAAANGVEAVAAYTERNPDCVLMDLQMPEMDGMEATRKIRALETALQIRPAFISALTANILPEDKQRCFSYGMNAYLNKPVKSQTIANVLVDAWKFRHPAN